MIYEKLAAYYDQFIDEELYLEYVKLINKYYSEGNLLDLGCGTAQLAIKLAEKLGMKKDAVQQVNFEG